MKIVNIQQKIIQIPVRIFNIFSSLPTQLLRILQHIKHGLKSGQFSRVNLLFWWWELGMLLLSTIGVFHLYEIFSDFFKPQTRLLNAHEQRIAQIVFKDCIDYRKVRVDETAQIACRNSTLKYVSFNTINSWGKLSDSIFVHEMVHVWQYQRIGATYIPKALKVHLLNGTYDYGGVSALYKAQKEGKHFLAFNFEQQADIITDYFRLLKGLACIWGNGDQLDLPIYEHFVAQMRYY